MKNISYIRYAHEEDHRGEIVKKMIVPGFFNMISTANDYRIFEKFNTPMDILQEVLVFEASNYKTGDKNKEFSELLCSSKDTKGRISKDSVNAIFKIVEKCGKKINGLKLQKCTLNSSAKKTVEKKPDNTA
jgi:hypothetical protein